MHLSSNEFGKHLIELTQRKVQAKGKVVNKVGKRVDAYVGIELLVEADTDAELTLAA